MKRIVNHAVGRERFAEFLLSRSILCPTSNSNRKEEEIEQNRLMLAIAGVWLLSFFFVVMWAWQVTFG